MRRRLIWLLSLGLIAVSGWLWQERYPFAIIAILVPPPPGDFIEGRLTGIVPPEHRGTPVYKAPEDRFATATFPHLGAQRRWHWIAPKGTSVAPAPVIVMLHGSGRNGAAMLDMWQSLGDGTTLLIAPDAQDPVGWTMARDGPDYLAAVMAEASRIHPIDSDRMFLVGHSAGANHALQLANIGGPWRAVAVHAGAMQPRDIIPQQDGAPLLMIVGDGDAFFPVAAVRQSAMALALAGHDVDLRIIPGHDHWFYAIAAELVPLIRDFLFGP